MAPLTCHKTILPLDYAAVWEPYAAVARVVVDGGDAEGGVAAVPLAGPRSKGTPGMPSIAGPGKIASCCLAFSWGRGTACC